MKLLRSGHVKKTPVTTGDRAVSEHHLAEVRRAYRSIGEGAERSVENDIVEAIAVFVERCCDPPNAFSKSLVASIRAGHWKAQP